MACVLPPAPTRQRSSSSLPTRPGAVNGQRRTSKSLPAASKDPASPTRCRVIHHCGSPSPSAAHHNTRAALLAIDLERASTAKGRLRTESGTPVVAEHLPPVVADGWNSSEAFHAKAGTVSSALEQMVRNIRMEHLVTTSSGPGDDTSRYSAEEIKRRREAEQRRRWKEEQEARDPKKKVALRLEHMREFGSDPGTEPGAHIPMVGVTFDGCRGRERLSLVDVHILQSRCNRLEGSFNVQTMLNTMEHEERQRKTLSSSSSLPALSPSGSETPLGCLSPSFSSSLQLASLSREERQARCQAQKKAKRFDSMLRKLNTMRGEPTAVELRRFESLARDVVQADCNVSACVGAMAAEKSSRTAAFLTSSMHMGDRECGLTRDIAVSLGAHGIEASSSTMQRFVAHSESVAAKAEEGKRGRAPSPKAAVFRLAALNKLSLVGNVRKERARKRIRLFRAFALALTVFFKRRRVARAPVIVKNFLSQVADWAQIKFSIQLFRVRVVLLQRAVRTFLQRRRTRLEQMHNTWARIEDQHLRGYYDLALGDHDELKAILKEVCPVSKGSGVDSLPEGVAKLRIPVSERTAMLNRYFTVQTWKQLKTVEAFQNVVHEVEEDWDNQARRALFGSVVLDESAKKELALQLEQHLKKAAQQPPKPDRAKQLLQRRVKGPATGGAAMQNAGRPFWEMQEELVLNFIAVAAQGLRDSEPFRGHPVNLREAGADIDPTLFGPMPQAGFLKKALTLHG